MSVTDWKEAIAKARCLEGGSLLDGMSDTDVMKVCNGVGAKWADSVGVCGITLSDIANFVLSWAVPSSIIHDIRYDIGGDYSDKVLADVEFQRNLKSSLGAWYDPRRYIRMWEARKMDHLLKIGGWVAFNWK